MSDIECPAPLTAPVHYYEHWCGDQRPGADTLNNVLDYVVCGEFKTAALSLTAGNACIDLALADPGRTTTWIQEADAFFADILGEVPPADAAPAQTKKIAHLATEAALRKAELQSWEAASSNQLITPNYHHLLEAAKAVAWLGPLHHMADSKLIEFMPVLLGARWLARGHLDGWRGRLSLVREGHQWPTLIGNPNWDTGIVFDESAASFDDPPLHLELKRGGTNNGLGRYAAYGTLALRARKYGLDKVSEIILGCAQESDYSLAAIPGYDTFKHVQPHTSEQLDEVTAKLRARMDESIRAGLGNPNLKDRH